MKRARAALAAARRQAVSLPGEWPLTLHMLQGHAPQFFSSEGLGKELEAALDGLSAVPAHLEAGLDEPEAMARIDALYLKQLRGRPVPALDVEVTRACLDHVEQTAGPLHAWLMGELLAPLGLPLRRRYERISEVHDLYWLTHLVLLDTDYLQRPVRGLGAELDELQSAVPTLWFPPQIDLLGEVLFCLQNAGRDVAEPVERYAAFQSPDGGFSDGHGVPGADAHCTAVALIALARAGA